MELLPDLFEGGLVCVADDDSAAGSAKDACEGIDVNALGAQERIFAVGFLKLVDRLCGDELGEFVSGGGWLHHYERHRHCTGSIACQRL